MVMKIFQLNSHAELCTVTLVHKGMAGNHAVLNEGEENEMEIFGYKSEWWKKALCILFYIISIGLLKLLFYWKPELDVWCLCVPCNLAVADTVLLQTTGEHKYYLKKLVIQVRLKRTMKSGYPVISDGYSVIHKSIMEPEGKVRYIQVQKIRYVLIPSEGKFMKTGVLEESLSCSDIHSKYGFGLSKEEQELRRQICGLNTITVKITPVWTLLTKEVFNPFYVFQLYCFGVWIATQYIEFSLAILLLTIVSISATVYNLRMQSVKLNRMSTSYNSILVSVLHKNGELEEVQSQSLVPGDVIVLSGNKLFLPCDAILISGGCTVNEAMLTGESIPVTKTPLPNIKNSIPWMAHSGEDYKKHVLYCGTEVIQAKRNNQDLVKAVVLQTGFNTAKGDLVRAILYNKPVDIKLHKEAIRFLMFLLIFAIFTVAYTVAVLKMNGANVHDIVLMSFLAITIAVNPALPASLTFCLLCGQTRLKKLGIFCISPQRINLAGQLNLVCFDKTGTLTEDVLDLYGVLPCEKSCFQDIIFFKPSNNLCWCPILQAMTSCHSLITLDGKLQGDPLDIKMFGGTGWKLEDLKVEINDDPVDNCTVVKPGPTAAEVPVEGIQILQQFPFSSSLQRMSVITQVIGESNLTVFMKGAPEMVVHFCKPETIPHSFSAKLGDYTVQGFRVLGLAYRSFQKGLPKVSDIDREEVECDLTFLGLLIMENQLKPETTSVLQELNEANIRTVMITGDNLQTAVTVGKKSGMIPSNSNIIMLEACEPENDLPASITWKSLTENQEDENNSKAKESQRYVGERLINNPTTLGNFHFAMNGTSYQILTQHFSNLLPTVLLNGTIFARMTPKQKSSIIEELQKLDYFVGMCGDGANDCGALKMANAGISLSELEASVASPFTSKFPSIKCVPSLIKEGRNTLVTSFSLFKFLTVLPIIIMVCMLILFWKQTLLGNYQYLIQDLGINITVFLTMSLNHPSPKLAPYRPSGQLLSPPLLFSVLMQLVFAVIVQTTAFLLLQQQPWFNETDVFSACLPLNYSTGNITVREHRYAENFFTTTMFPITTFHQIVAAIVFAKGKPFRQPLYTNYLLSIVITLLTVVGLFLLFADIDTVYTAMELVCTPYYWRVNILIMVIVLLIVSYIAEMWFLENRELWLWIKKLFKYKSKSQYRKMQRRMQKDSEWPPQNKTDYAVQYVSVEDSNIVACSSTTPNIAKYSKQTIITVL